MTAQDVKLPDAEEMARALERDATRARRSRRELVMRLVPVIMLVAIYVLFAVVIELKLRFSEGGLDNAFLTFDNVARIARQTTMVGIAGLGMTLVIILGGIDLSVGSCVALTSVVIAALLGRTAGAGTGPVSAALAGILVGAFAGVVTGILITRLRVVPFIVTLGMMLILRGGAKMIAGEQKIDAAPKGLKSLLAELRVGDLWFSVPGVVWIAVGLVAGALVAARHVHLGRRAAASAREGGEARSHAPAGRMRAVAFAACGAAVGLAGFHYWAYRAASWGTYVTVALAATACGLLDCTPTGRALVARTARVLGMSECHGRAVACGVFAVAAGVAGARMAAELPLPPGVWIMIALAAVTWVILDYTRFGRHVVAIGSNEQTARLCGVPVERVKILVYTICGLAAGITGLMQFSRLSVGDPTTAVGMELNVIAAVVIGGGSFSGGEGSILGTIVGAFIMSVIRAGCSQLDIANYWQEIVTGAILIAAVWFDLFRKRRAAG